MTKSPDPRRTRRTTFDPLRLQAVPLYSWIFRQLPRRPLPKVPDGELYRTKPPSELYHTQPPTSDLAGPPLAASPAPSPTEAEAAGATPPRVPWKLLSLAIVVAVVLGAGLWLVREPSAQPESQIPDEPARALPSGGDAREALAEPPREPPAEAAREASQDGAAVRDNADPPASQPAARKPSTSSDLQQRLADPDALLIRPE